MHVILQLCHGGAQESVIRLVSLSFAVSSSFNEGTILSAWNLPVGLCICFEPWWRHQMETFFALLAFVWGIIRSPVNSPHKGQWLGALKCAWSNSWAKSGDAGDLRLSRPLWRHRNALGGLDTKAAGHQRFSNWFHQHHHFDNIKLWLNTTKLSSCSTVLVLH